MNTAGKLKERYILWTSIVSTGRNCTASWHLLLRFSCQSLNADYVAPKCLHLKYQSLETPVAVSVADANSQLKAVDSGNSHTVEQW